MNKLQNFRRPKTQDQRRENERYRQGRDDGRQRTDKRGWRIEGGGQENRKSGEQGIRLQVIRTAGHQVKEQKAEDGGQKTGYEKNIEYPPQGVLWRTRNIEARS